MRPQNIHVLTDLDLSISSIQLIVDRTCSPGWIHHQKQARPFHGLVYILEGNAVFDFGDVQVRAEKDQLVYLPQGSCYYTAAGNAPIYRFIVVSFQVSAADSPAGLPLETQIQPLNPGHYRTLFQQLSTHWSQKGVAHKIHCKAFLYEILFSLLQDTFHMGLQGKSCSKVQRAREYIDNNLEKEISMEQLSRIADMSATHFRRMFKEIYRVSPQDYLINSRVGKARDLILSDLYSFGEIAEKVGLVDVFYFSRVFKKRTGLSPSAFRKQYGFAE